MVLADVAAIGAGRGSGLRGATAAAPKIGDRLLPLDVADDDPC